WVGVVRWEGWERGIATVPAVSSIVTVLGGRDRERVARGGAGGSAGLGEGEAGGRGGGGRRGRRGGATGEGVLGLRFDEIEPVRAVFRIADPDFDALRVGGRVGDFDAAEFIGRKEGDAGARLHD